MDSFRLQLRLTSLGVWLAGVVMVVGAGFLVDGYQLHVRKIPLPHQYPIGGVAWTCGVITLESALLHAFLTWRAPSLSLWRVIAAIAAAIAMAMLSGMFSYHQPPYVYWHGFWLTIVALVLMCVAAITLLTRGLVRHAGPRNGVTPDASGALR